MNSKVISAVFGTSFVALATASCGVEAETAASAPISSIAPNPQQTVKRAIQKEIGERAGFDCTEGLDSCMLEFSIENLRVADSCEELGLKRPGFLDDDSTKLLRVDTRITTDANIDPAMSDYFLGSSSWSFQTADDITVSATEWFDCVSDEISIRNGFDQPIVPGSTVIRHELYELPDDAVALRLISPDSESYWEWDLTDVSNTHVHEVAFSETTAPSPVQVETAAVPEESLPENATTGFDSVFTSPGTGVPCLGTDAWVIDPVFCELAEVLSEPPRVVFRPADPEPVTAPTSPAIEDPPRADGCVGPAAVCGYYDENGNPIWFDKQTLETSPRYYDENGNPTMTPPQ